MTALPIVAGLVCGVVTAAMLTMFVEFSGHDAWMVPSVAAIVTGVPVGVFVSWLIGTRK